MHQFEKVKIWQKAMDTTVPILSNHFGITT